jgi:hypothetical protein
MNMWAIENSLKWWRSCYIPQTAKCGDLSSVHVIVRSVIIEGAAISDRLLLFLQKQFSSHSKNCIRFEETFLKKLGLDLLQIMQCWMFSMSIFKVEFCLKYQQISDMAGPGQLEFSPEIYPHDSFLWKLFMVQSAHNSRTEARESSICDQH